MRAVIAAAVFIVGIAVLAAALRQPAGTTARATVHIIIEGAAILAIAGGGYALVLLALGRPLS